MHSPVAKTWMFLPTLLLLLLVFLPASFSSPSRSTTLQLPSAKRIAGTAPAPFDGDRVASGSESTLVICESPGRMENKNTRSGWIGERPRRSSPRFGAERYSLDINPEFSMPFFTSAKDRDVSHGAGDTTSSVSDQNRGFDSALVMLCSWVSRWDEKVDKRIPTSARVLLARRRAIARRRKSVNPNHPGGRKLLSSSMHRVIRPRAPVPPSAPSRQIHSGPGTR